MGLRQGFGCPARASGLTGAVLLVGSAFAAYPGAAQAENLTYQEVKLGVLAHDVHFLGGKEHGVDVNPELLLQSPIEDSWLANVPGYLRWALQPRPMIGLEINTAGYTDQLYLGATWTWQVASGVLTPDDGLVFSYGFGPGFNDGEIQSNRSDRKSLGGHVLFRESFEFGYRFTPVYQVSAYLDHISNGGLDRYNQSINDVGIRLGVRF